MIPFSDFEPLTNAFKNALSKLRIAIAPDGELNRLCDLTLRLARGELSQTERQSADALEDIAGFVTFARKVVRIFSHRDFLELTDHMRMLESGKIKLNAPDTDPNTKDPSFSNSSLRSPCSQLDQTSSSMTLLVARKAPTRMSSPM